MIEIGPSAVFTDIPRPRVCLEESESGQNPVRLALFALFPYPLTHYQTIGLLNLRKSYIPECSNHRVSTRERRAVGDI